MGVQVSKEQPNLLDDTQSSSSSIVNYQCEPHEHGLHSPTYDVKHKPAVNFQQASMLLDPRSPSVGIERTPIQLPKVEPQPVTSLDRQLPSACIERIPPQLHNVNPEPETLLDPRSPSFGIDRTPLQLHNVNLEPVTLLDPRSPSFGIERTPLQLHNVNPQPVTLLDPRSPSIAIERTPLQLHNVNPQPVTLLDPRSPSIAIERTPLQLHNVNPQPVMLLDPRSPSIAIERTPIVVCGQNGIAGSVTKQDCDIKGDSLISDYIPFEIEAVSPLPENIFCNTEAESSIPDTIAFNLDAADDSLLENINMSPVSTTSEGCEIVSKPVPKITAKKSLHESSSSGSRSPLATVNHTKLSSRSGVDTPRGIVQRKQALRVERLRNNVNSPVKGGRNYQVYCDKENNV